MKVLFVADPKSALVPGHDTTLELAHALRAKRHRVDFCIPSDLLWNDGRTVVAPTSTPLEEYDTVAMRKDPPADFPYITACDLLSKVRPSKTWIWNRPETLMRRNEKLWALEFSEWMVPTLVSSRHQEIVTFARRFKKGCILKPLNQMGGQGVFRFENRPHDTNLPVIIETLTQGGRVPIMVQEWIPGVLKKGDVRALWIDDPHRGFHLGAIARIPARGDHRGNMARGARVVSHRLTNREKKILDALTPSLREEGIFLAGIDLIDGQLTEINITSPTGLAEIKKLQNAKAPSYFVQALEKNIGLET